MLAAFVDIRAQMLVFGVQPEARVAFAFISDRFVNTYVRAWVDRRTLVNIFYE